MPEGAGQGHNEEARQICLCLSSLRRCALYQNVCQEHDTGNMVAFVKSDPLSVPRARHDLIKSCLPLVGAAVFKISLKTHPRWPQADHFLHTRNIMHIPLGRAGLHSREMASLTTRAQGSVALLLILRPHALSHSSFRIRGWDLVARERPG